MFGLYGDGDGSCSVYDAFLFKFRLYIFFRSCCLLLSFINIIIFIFIIITIKIIFFIISDIGIGEMTIYYV